MKKVFLATLALAAIVIACEGNRSGTTTTTSAPRHPASPATAWTTSGGPSSPGAPSTGAVADVDGGIW